MIVSYMRGWRVVRLNFFCGYSGCVSGSSEVDGWRDGWDGEVGRGICGNVSTVPVEE